MCGKVSYEDVRKDNSKLQFGWILESNSTQRANLLNFYEEGQWQIAFVERKMCINNDWETSYIVGNPLLGGLKTYRSYNTAEKYFFEMVGRIHIDAEIRNKGVA